MEKSLSELLELRSKIKEEKPDFIRQDNPKRMKLNDKWRKPKGIHSKIRHHFKGRRKTPSPGYKSPKKVRGLDPSGLEMINAHSIDDVAKIKKETQGIIIAKSVGMKKRLEIFKKAKELNVAVLNLNVDEQIKKIESFISSKNKKEPTEAKKEKGEKAAKIEQKEGMVQKEDIEMRDEQRKEAEKKEKDKILTKRT